MLRTKLSPRKQAMFACKVITAIFGKVLVCVGDFFYQGTCFGNYFEHPGLDNGFDTFP
jgi:hypothetical protein